jgi:hypothetical protein
LFEFSIENVDSELAKMTSESEERLPTISDDLVVTKYKMAAEIVNRKSELPANHEFPVVASLRLETSKFVAALF